MTHDINAAGSAQVDWATARWKPRFFIIWSGQAASLIGSALTQFVLIWWITDTTGSANALATAGIMALLPQAIFGPIGGTLADRWNRRTIMIVSDSITALSVVVLMLLFATDTVQVWHVYLVMFLRSTMQAFQSPAMVATTSLIVPPWWLSRVSAMNQTVVGLMSVASAPLGAALLAVLPLQTALMVDVVTAALAITPLLFFRLPQITRTDMDQRSPWQDFRDGLRFVTGNRGIVYLYGITFLMFGVIMPAVALMPIVVRNEFGGGINEVALMEGFGGLGMALGGIIVSIVALPRRQMPFVLIMYALSCITVSAIGLVSSEMFWAAVFWWFISGVFYTAGHAPVFGILQRIIPNQMQGRAFSLLTTIIGFASPLGIAVAAPLAEAFGVRMVFIAGGVISTIVCLAGLFSPALMSLETGGDTAESAASHGYGLNAGD